MAKPRERKTERKVNASTAAHARRANADPPSEPPPEAPEPKKPARTRRATAAASSSRDLTGVASRRIGADRALTRTVKLVDVAADDALASLYRLAVLDYLFLTTKCRELEVFYAHLHKIRVTEKRKTLKKGQKLDAALCLTDTERRQLAEQVRQFATGKNRALQTALNVQKQYAEQHLAENPDGVTFDFEEPEASPPPPPPMPSVH